MRLKYQLFLTLLAASAVLIALMYFISSRSFSSGFLEYVNQNEADRLQAVADQLIERYEVENGWRWADKKSVANLAGFSSRGRGASRPRNRDVGSIEDRSEDRSEGRREDGDGKRPGRRPTSRSPLILTDAAKQPLVGELRPDTAMNWLALEASAGGVVGYLVTPKIERINRQFDQLFEQKQKKSLGLTALAMIFFSGLLSIPLASRIVKPLLTVNSAVGEISSGNYAHRVDVNRRDEIGDLADKINLLGYSLEQNRDARHRWIAEISHELRTPLAVLRGEIEAVQDGVRIMDEQAVESLHGEVLSLGRLIDDLHTLSVSDVGALDYRLAVLDLNKLLADFLDSQQEMLADNALTLTRDIGREQILVQGDAQRLEQLFANLMQNTCRYTDSEGALHVDVKIANLNSDKFSGSDAVVIDWFDSSPGVESDALSQLFDPLFRTESSRNREYGGTGLGLSIAKRIVEAHQGSIKATQSELGGLHLQIELPLFCKQRASKV